MNKVSNKLFLLAAVVIVLNVSSCGKYEDGPNFSLRTKKARLTGEWEVIEIDGEKVKDSGFEYQIEFEKKGDCTLNYSGSYYGYSFDYEVDGEWEWADKKEAVEVDLDGLGKIEWEIKRLTNSEFWFEDEDNAEYKCEKK